VEVRPGTRAPVEVSERDLRSLGSHRAVVLVGTLPDALEVGSDRPSTSFEAQKRAANVRAATDTARSRIVIGPNTRSKLSASSATSSRSVVVVGIACHDRHQTGGARALSPRALDDARGNRRYPEVDRTLPVPSGGCASCASLRSRVSSNSRWKACCNHHSVCS